MSEIHQEKGEVIEHVDGREVLVELEAIEQGGLALEHADVAQDEIAMAAADLIGLAARVEKGPAPLQLLSKDAGKPLRLLCRKEPGRTQRLFVDVEHVRDGHGAPMASAHLRCPVEGRDPAGEIGHEAWRQRAAE